MKRYLIPAALFIVLIGFLAVGLKRDPRDVPSPLVGKPAPTFTLPQLDNDKQFATSDLRGQVWLLNVWASWCVSCREEHPVLVKFSTSGATSVPIVGLSYKEVRGDASIDAERMSAPDEMRLARQRADAWLVNRGNPYALTAMDLDGRVGIDYGVYGVPETYVIDKRGTIRMKHTGPITEQSLAERIVPLLAELNKKGS